MASTISRVTDFVPATPILSNEVDQELNSIVNLLNATSSAFKARIKVSDAGDPPLELDQLSTGPIQKWFQGGILKASVNNDGSFETSDQFISTVVTGTAPLVVASTTLIPNLNADLLDGLHQSSFARDPGGNGLVVRTGVGSAVARSLAQPAAGLTITNADGVSGNPTFALANDLSALEGLGGTGFAVRTAADTWAQRTIIGTANQVNVSNGDGVSGNPTLSLPQDIHTGASPTFGGLSITGNSTLGTGGTSIKKIVSSTVDVDPPNIGANSDGAVNVTITGVAAGDLVLMTPNAGLEAGLIFNGCQAGIAGSDLVTVNFRNVTGGAINGANRTWTFIWLDLT